VKVSQLTARKTIWQGYSRILWRVCLPQSAAQRSKSDSGPRDRETRYRDIDKSSIPRTYTTKMEL